jgi:hypothetical protein
LGFVNKLLLDAEQQFGNKWASVERDEPIDIGSVTSDLTQFQNPEEADKILKIQKGLDEIRDIMKTNIVRLLFSLCTFPSFC